MVALSSLFNSLPELGTHLISTVYGKYNDWISNTEVPAFHKDGKSLVFRNGTILLNKQDMEELVDQAQPHVTMEFWLGLSETLKTYRAWYFKEVRARKQLDDVTDSDIAGLDDDAKAFEHLAHRLFEKIYRRLKRRYDETTDGLSFHLDEEGSLTINGMKVEAFLEMATRYPTDKARTFLKGLRNRLSVILSNRHGNPNYDKIRDSSNRVFAEIDRLLGGGKQRVLLLPEARTA